MGADGAVGEHGKAQLPHLVHVPPGAAADKPDRAEGLVDRAHDLAEGGGDGGVVEVLKYHNRWPRQFRETLHLGVQGRISIALPGRGGGAEGGGGGETHDRSHLGKAGRDAAVHVADVAGPDVEQLDQVADGGRVESPELVEGGEGDHGVFSLPQASSATISMAWQGHCSKQAAQPVQRS